MPKTVHSQPSPQALSADGGNLRPLLKWPGGKGAELNQILAAAPPSAARYFEPFVGGGAVFFAISSTIPAFINDASAELMDIYNRVNLQDKDFFRHLNDIRLWWDRTEEFVETHGGELVNLFISTRSSHQPLACVSTRIVLGLASHLRETSTPSWEDLSELFLDLTGSSVPKKMERMRKIEEQRGQRLPLDDVWRNIEGAFKAACYTTLRTAYNSGRVAGTLDPRQTALFFFLREYAYAAMFRFNGKGEFNVPYGGISYNRKNMIGKIRRMSSPETVRRLASTTIGCEDFEMFLDRHHPGPNDFVFLDPPYDSDFSDYDANGFDRHDHARLADVMKRLESPFQLVIKSTPAVLDLYGNPDWNVRAFNKKYMWTIKERNDRNATHLMITNYN